MRLKYDMSVGALYIRLTDAPVARTREVDDNTMVDLDAAGEVIGIEVVSIAHPWPVDEVLRSCAIPAGEEAQIRAYFTSPLLYAAPAVSVDRNAPAEPVCVPA